jgi:hypothetical protein
VRSSCRSLLRLGRCPGHAERLAEISERIIIVEQKDGNKAFQSADNAMRLSEAVYGEFVDRAAKHFKRALDTRGKERRVRLAEMINSRCAVALEVILKGLSAHPAEKAD